MRTVWRRLRGALGTGLAWAVGWSVVGALFGLGTAIAYPGVFGVLESIAKNGAGFAMYGFVGGSLFSVVLGLAEGRKRFDELSLLRFTGWGGAGGGLLGLVVVATDMWAVGSPVSIDVALVGVAGILGAGCAAGSLALARSADDAHLLTTGAEAAQVGLTEAEARRLLGTSDRLVPPS
jgi:hypothetical protein